MNLQKNRIKALRSHWEKNSYKIFIQTINGLKTIKIKPSTRSATFGFNKYYKKDLPDHDAVINKNKNLGWTISF